MTRFFPWIVALSLLAAPGLATEDRLSKEELQKVYARCGSEIDWVDSWKEAARRAKREKKPVLVLVRSLAGFDIPDSSMIGPFSNEDVVELTNNRYVALRYRKGSPAPFTSFDVYGMGPLTFGTSILVADARGKILGDTFSLEDTSLYDFLVAKAADFPVSPPRNLSGAELADWHVAHGELDVAAGLLETPTTAEEFRVRGTIHRLRREGEDALRDFRRAHELTPTPRLAVEVAQMLLVTGRFEEAERWLDKAGEAPLPLMLLGALRIAQGRTEEGIRHWTRLVRNHPDERWAWPAAAYLATEILLESAAGRDGMFAWPSPESLAILERRPWEPLKRSQIDRAIDDAREFLLEHQLADGSWVNGSEVMSSGDRFRNPFVIAITAWGGRSLLPYRDDPRVAAAIQRALGFLTGTRSVLDRNGEPFSVMDYFVWSKPSVLLFLADAIEAGVASRERWQPVMETLIAEIGEKQKPGGGWSYYKGGDISNLDATLNVSFSFVTAYVLLGLAAARDADVEVPEEISTRALACLEKTRNRDESYEYSIFHANENAPRRPMPAGAAGRGPLCSLALRVWKRTKTASVRTSLDLFDEHKETYAREHGKTLMHCGPEGQGSHYLMFDYATATAAYESLPGKKERYRKMLLSQILAARTDAGSYLDNPLLGDHYGTAMGLWSLEHLRGRN